MSRVHYTNESIRKAITELVDLEQTMGWNLRCSDPSEPAYHQDAIPALVQILKHFPKIRRLLDEVEAEVMDVFVQGTKEGLDLVEAVTP
jgi:hypothetical protein